MRKRIACRCLLAFAVLFLASSIRAEEGTEKYLGATRLMGVAAKAKYEGKDEIAWGEYARAYEILAEIQSQHPKWQRKTVAASMERCRQEMDELNPESLSGDQSIIRNQQKAIELLAKVGSQVEEMIKVIDEKRDLLEAGELRSGEAEEEGEMPGVEAKDTDADGLTDEREKVLGTNPSLHDTDADGLNDYDEVETYGTSPTVEDTDLDGLTDGFEVLSFDTDPLNPDTDADELNDGEEKEHGTDPNIPDTDGDGYTDGREVDEGTDPLDEENHPWD